MKRMARAAEDPLVVRIPEVVRIAPVAVEPQLRIIAFHAEDVRVAVRINNV